MVNIKVSPRSLWILAKL